MGLNKRFISEETISNTLKNGDSLKKLFSAVNHMHKMGIVHRDL